MLKILCLSKRRPQGRDLLTRPYGRFYHIPIYLSQRGHSVQVILTSYLNAPETVKNSKGVEWHSVSFRPMSLERGLLRYLFKINKMTKEYQPDWIFGFSDSWYGILAYFLAQRHGAKSLIDAYDNYESYIPWAKPLHWVWRYCLRKTTALSATGPGLAKLMSRGRTDSAAIIPMAADPCFYPMDKELCRQKLNLPLKSKLIGYSGAVYNNRGIEMLFTAFKELQKKHPEVQLVISGRRSKSVKVPEEVLWMGYLSDENVPFLMNSLDVMVVLNKQSSFGEFSYPAKLYEAMRCQIPVVATDTGGVRWVLRDESIRLIQPTDVAGLADEIGEVLKGSKKRVYSGMNNWEDSLKQLITIITT